MEADQSPLELDALLHEIERVPVDRATLEETANPYDHRLAAHSLLREATQLAVLAASLFVGEDDSWSRDEAILTGHQVRLSKLLRWVLEEVGRDRADLFFIAMRSTGECIINFRYLLKHHSPELCSSYVHQSLQADVKLEDTILKNIESRNGEVLPIESRMLASIERDRRHAGVERSEIPTKRIRDFGGRNLFEKAEGNNQPWSPPSNLIARASVKFFIIDPGSPY